MIGADELAKSKDTISDGKFVLVQRGDQERIIEFKAQETLKYGRGASLQEIELKNADGSSFNSTFRVKYLGSGGNGKAQGQGRTGYLEPVTDTSEPVFLTERNVSGKDNRNIKDDNKSQPLGSTDIATLREKGASGPEILGTLVMSSTTFGQKTEFAQEKYLKKKERSYGDTLVFLKPTLSIIADYYYKKDPARVMNLRADSISQMLSYANVHGGGTYMVYETGCSGLLIASVLYRLGGYGTCLHIHAGSTPNRQAIFYLNLATEQLQALQSLDIFYTIRPPLHAVTAAGLESKLSSEEPEAKKAKVEDSEVIREPSDGQEEKNPVAKLGNINRHENDKSVLLLNSTEFDGLIICSKEHPLNILQNLLRHLAPAAPFVLYCQYPEPLTECYAWLKQNNLGVNLNLVENWFRNIQVETERTHPEINMSSNGGYLLFGIHVR